MFTVLYYAKYCTIQFIVPYSLLYYIVYYNLLSCTILCTIIYNTVLYCTVQYCAVLFSPAPVRLTVHIDRVISLDPQEPAPYHSTLSSHLNITTLHTV